MNKRVLTPAETVAILRRLRLQRLEKIRREREMLNQLQNRFRVLTNTRRFSLDTTD